MKTCFVISSIGNRDSLKRRKADALLNHIIKPVLEELDYDVVRADELAAPNSINKGIVEQLENSDLVIADVHDHNPNVFYELGIRNVVNKPYILFRKGGEDLPFDINEFSAIDHPFPEIDQEDDDEICQTYENGIRKAREILKKHANHADENKEDGAESIASRYLKMIPEIKHMKNSLEHTTSKLVQQKKNLKIFAISFVAMMIVMLYFFTFSMVEHDDEIHAIIIDNQKLILNEQSRQIESDIYNHIDMVIFTTLEFETYLKYMYDEGPRILNSSPQVTTTEFVENLKEHGNFVGPFEKGFLTTPVSSYLYLHEHGDPCTFVAYGYLDKMERDGYADDVEIEKIGRGLQSCDLMEKYEMIIADIHASTGTIDYSFPVARNVDLIPDDEKDDMVISTSIDLVRFSEQIRSSIHLDDVRFVLENKYSQVVFDCMNDGCPLNYQDIAKNEDKDGMFSKHSKPLTYNLGDFPDYEEYQSIELDNNNLTNPPKNSILLEGWTLHVLVPNDNSVYVKP